MLTGRRRHTIKVAIFLRLMYWFSASQNQRNFSVEISKVILKFTWNWKGLRMVKKILKHNNVEGLMSGHLNLPQSSNNQAHGEDIRTDLCNTTENWDINPCVL